MFTLNEWNKKTKKGITKTEKRTPEGIQEVYTIEGWTTTKSFSRPDNITRIKHLIKEAESINKRVFDDIKNIELEAAQYNIDFEEYFKDKLVTIDSYVAFYMFEEAEENYKDFIDNCPI